MRSEKWFREKPGNAAVYDSLKTVMWNFQLDRTDKLIGCGVCEKRWEDVIGEKPTRFFET
jgi:hypothetical protein